MSSEDSFSQMPPEFFLHDPGKVEEDDTLSTSELEQLYQQALQASEILDAFEEQIPAGLVPAQDAAGTQAQSQTNTNAVTPGTTTGTAINSGGNQSSEIDSTGEISTGRDIRPSQILEAALFVGGTRLTLKKLSRLLGEQPDEEIVEAEIQKLNAKYASQGRPYEIRFGEGGYRMSLKSEFNRIRDRSFGLGPKEVKLSLPLLEILAFVAYRQPVTRQEIDETGKKNAIGLVSQLVRRKLVSLERTGKTQKEVEYSTTERFLEVFGLRSLDDLPHPDDFSFK